MDVELITIGDELLLGFTIDTNAAHLARELAPIGIGIRRRADHESARVNPVHLVVAAILFVVLFVLALRFVVSLVVS